MINIANISARQAESYYEKDDYYTENASMPAKFSGDLAAELGLMPNTFSLQHFKNALRGEFAIGKLKQTHSGARAGLDCTFSAPKSISIMALVGGDHRLITAHELAVEKAMTQVSKLAQIRVTEDGKTSIQKAEKIAYATFQHHTSRAGDPQLHSHNVIFNVTKGADGELRSLTNDEILQAQHALDAEYKVHLRREVEVIGYSVRDTKNGFELADVRQEAIDHFSQRKRDIDEALREDGVDRDKASAAKRQAAALKTRDAKVAYDRKLLQQHWQARLQEIDASLPTRPITTPELRVHKQTENSTSKSMSNLRSAVSHFAERSSVISNRYSLIAKAMEFSQYQSDFAEIDSAVSEMLGAGELKQGRNARRVVPKQTLERERKFIDRYLESRDTVESVSTKTGANNAISSQEDSLYESRIKSLNDQGIKLDNEDINKIRESTKLTAGQREMVERIADSRDSIMIVEGDAGAGKSTALNAVREMANKNGFNVVGLAPSAQAVESLQNSAGIETITSQRAGVDAKFWESIDERTLVVLDEAGLVDTKAMEHISEKVIERGARLLLVGDTKQFAAVEAGRPMSQIKDIAENDKRLIRLDEMRRGRTSEMQTEHETARDNPAESIKKLVARDDTVSIVNENKRHAAIGRAYSLISPDDRKATLILTGINEDRMKINAAVREQLGLAGKGTTIQTFDRRDLTDSEKRQLGSYNVGDTLRFESKVGEFEKGSVLTVADIKSDRLMLTTVGVKNTNARGNSHQLVELKPSTTPMKSVSVGRMTDIELSLGDQIRFTASTMVGKTKIANGQRGEIRDISQDSMSVRMASGNDVEIPHRQNRPLSLSHGYAQTGHSAQGATAKHVLLHVRADDPTVNRNSFYTTVTRAAETIQVFTNALSEKSISQLSNRVKQNLSADSAIAEVKNDHVTKPNSFTLNVNARDTKETLLKKLHDISEGKRNTEVEVTGDFDKTLLAAEIAGSNKLNIRFTDNRLDSFRQNIESATQSGTASVSVDKTPSQNSQSSQAAVITMPTLLIDQAFDPV
jgi:conjugative relaxase-like TrwC/TraI family protein